MGKIDEMKKNIDMLIQQDCFVELYDICNRIDDNNKQLKKIKNYIIDKIEYQLLTFKRLVKFGRYVLKNTNSPREREKVKKAIKIFKSSINKINKNLFKI